MVKIRLTQDVPVGKEHGMTKGRVFDAIVTPIEIREITIEDWKTNAFGDEVVAGYHKERDAYEWFWNGKYAFWVEGYAGEAVKVWGRECEIVKDEDTTKE